MKILKELKMYFQPWKKISKHKVPKRIKGKLYKKNYVKDKRRLYKTEIRKKIQKNYRFAKQQGHWEIVHHLSEIPPGTKYFKEKTKRWKKVRYFYKNLP